ncbi:sialin [Drosophila guanche]|uniref:Blast:Sialin n=1 Tax=Drosophila guanche TaxID=7266 RepID=A0A3B0KVE4_DROGU|nr:sialin [Drosophila guanche]SPP87948.1 blast:Sialin [Drosophila guanche]
MVCKSWTLPHRVSGQVAPASHSLLGSVRLTYAVCAFLSICLHSAMRSMLAMVILRMVKPRPEDALLMALELDRSNSTAAGQCGGSVFGLSAGVQVPQTGDLSWTRNQELTFPGVFYYGYVISIPLAGHLSDRLSSKRLFILSLVFEALAYFLLPTMAHHSYGAAVASLVVSGMCAGCGNPPLYQLFVTWAHPTERTSLLSFAYIGLLMGSIVVYPVANYLSDYAWELSFYVVASVTLVFGIICHWLIYDTLDEHPRISDAEKAYLQREPLSKSQLSVPWRHLLTSLPVYAFILTHIFHNCTFLVLSVVMPRFMREAMQFNLHEVGLLSAAPYLGGMFSKLICVFSCGYVERRVGLKQSWMRRLLYVACSILTMIFIGIIICAGCEQKTLVMLMYALLYATTDMGFSAGYWPTLLYFAPSFAGLLSGVANCLAHLSGFLAPHLVATLVHTGTKAEWNIVLLTLIIFNGMAMIVFGLFSSTRLQPWDPRRRMESLSATPANLH